MTRLHYICVVGLVLSSLLFLATLQHQSMMRSDDLSFATVVSRVSDLTLPDSLFSPSNELQLVADRGAITEQRAIFVMVLLCLSICALVVIFVQREKKLKGRKEFQIPLVALSLILFATFVSLATRHGML